MIIHDNSINYGCSSKNTIRTKPIGSSLNISHSIHHNQDAMIYWNHQGCDNWIDVVVELSKNMINKFQLYIQPDWHTHTFIYTYKHISYIYMYILFQVHFQLFMMFNDTFHIFNPWNIAAWPCAGPFRRRPWPRRWSWKPSKAGRVWALCLAMTHFLRVLNVGNGWEWRNGMITTSDYDVIMDNSNS